MLRINHLRAYLGGQVKKLREVSKIEESEMVRTGGSQLGSACYCALGPDVF